MKQFKTILLSGAPVSQWVLAAVASLALFASAAAFAQEAGLEIGQRAPAFTLKDHKGRETSLDALLKKGPLVLVFYRSAGWCLACKLQLIQLQRHQKEIEAAGGQLAGISFDQSPVLKRFAEGQGITFPLLSDGEGRIIKAYGMNTPGAEGEWAAIAQHGTFVIDRNGIVRAKSLALSYDDPDVIRSLISALKEARTSERKSQP